MPSQLRIRPRAKAAQPGNLGQVGQGQNRESVNFSRPMSPFNSPPVSPLGERRLASPLPQSSQQQSSANAPNVGRLRDGEAESIQYFLQETAQAPVKKKKKKVAKNSEGSYLANGASGGRAAGTAVGSTPQRQQASTESTPSPAASSSQAPKVEESPRSLPRKKKKAAKMLESQRNESAYGSYASDSDSAVSDRSNATDRSRTYNTRAAGLLAKQPSIVREDREAEEQEDFRSPASRLGNVYENGNSLKGANSSQTQASTNAKRILPTHVKKSSLDIPNSHGAPVDQRGSGSNQAVRQQSLSPARAAHFSAQPILETPDNLMHQPPARSISPVKSALKHSPSRGPSPVAGNPVIGSQRRGPASEASDTTSMISDDGLKTVPKKKKSVRVSFDNESVVVGRAATPPIDQDSPMIASPQNKEASTRKWVGVGNDQNQITSNSSRGQDTAIQPTPVLPSFGSIRGRSEQETRMEILPETKFAATELGTSSDQRVGNILSRVFGSEEIYHTTPKPTEQTFNDPLPPEVTSVEGTGYQSDTETSASGDHAPEPDATGIVGSSVTSRESPSSAADPLSTAAPFNSNLVPLSNTNEVPSIAVQPATPALGDTPSISVQPATPGLDESQRGADQYWFDMPGGFPSSRDDLLHDPRSSSNTVPHKPSELTPATVGIAEPETEAVAAQHRPGTPVIGEVAEGLRIQTEPDASEDSDHTNDSIYSDAAEDLSDLEGDGFGSINAIVESPASPPLGIVQQKQAGSPTNTNAKRKGIRTIPMNRNESELSEPGSEAGWDQAQAYWSGLSQSRRQQIERAAAQDDAQRDSQVTKPRPKKKKVIPKKSPQTTSEPAQDRGYGSGLAGPSSDTAPSKAKAKAPAMRSSMRDIPSEPTPEPHMRTSMRGSVPAKPSIRASLPPESTTAQRGVTMKNRPLSAVTPADYNRPQAREVVKGHDRSVSLGSKNVTPSLNAKAKLKTPVSQPVRRTMSNGSDSSSSFKKSRPKPSDTGRYNMKRSMRGSSVDEGPVTAHSRASSMTARPSLPAETNRRPFSTVGPSMRSSMRDSNDLTKPSRTKSPSRFPGFGKSSKAKVAAKGPTSRFSSRFADSSDEDDGPITRRSRFADSSDEDEPAGLTPVRGIPRRIDEGDSTDLEDSSADEKALPRAGKGPTQPPTKLEGTALGAGSLRTIPESSGSPTALMGTGLQAKRAAEKEKKKRSFFGGLGSKKTPKAEPLALNTGGKAPHQDIVPTKPGRPLGANSPDAPASPQSSKQQRLLGPGSPGTVNTDTSTIAGKAKSPKLQRRISAQQAEKIQMKRGISDSWPLAQSPGGTSTPTMRPTTSDGTPKNSNGVIGLSGLSKELRADRPGLGDRQNTVETTATGGTGAVKKKKGWFKKAFGR